MTTLDLVDLSTSLPSPICEDTAVHALHQLAEVVVDQESPTSGQEQTMKCTTALDGVASVGRTAPLVLPLLEVPQRRGRTGTSMSYSLTGGKSQPEAPKGDSPSRKRGQSAIPQRASLCPREALSDIQVNGEYSHGGCTHAATSTIPNLFLVAE